MRKINKKILVAALSLLLVVCAFVTVLSFTMAADGGGDTTNTVEAEPDIDIVTIYNIDRIVQNSNSGSDPYFHIVEISSSSSYSAMSGSNTSEIFTEYVFNGYKTITDQSMKEGMIDYKAYDTVNMSDAAIQNCIDAIAKADLIYVHNDPYNFFGKNSNDIPEMIKLQLCSAAVGDYVPFIIDGPVATQEIIDDNSASYGDLATNGFKKKGGKYFTTEWNPTTQTSPLDYFTHKTSYYIQIDGSTRKSRWVRLCSLSNYDLTNLADGEIATSGDAVKDVVEGGEYYKLNDKLGNTASILVIGKGGSEKKISDLTKIGLEPLNDGTPEGLNYKLVTADTRETYAIDTVDKDGNEIKLIDKATADAAVYTKNLYSIKEDSPLRSAYASRKNIPGFVTYDYYDGGDPALDTIDYAAYDIVIVEAAAGLTMLSQENYNNLYSAMMGNVCILYDSSLATGSIDNSVSNDTDYGQNYLYVCGKTMTSTEVGKYDNILVTSPSRMKVYMSANNKEAVKDIADIINYASYRGIGGGNGDSSNLYTVLEIQPAYPIDTTLAKKFAKIDGGNHIKGYTDPLENNPYVANMTFAKVTGRDRPMSSGEYANTANNSWYYIRNQGVINNTTSDEISFDGEHSLTTFLESGDNITSAQLGTVTDYYAWTLSKAKIAHATGLEYNEVNVVHMSTYEFNCTKKTVLDNFDAIYIGGDNSGIKNLNAYHSSKLASIGLDTYNMYFTNGDAYDYSQKYGASDGSVGTLEGNDISKNKYDELMEYKKNGMPIIIGKDACAGLTSARRNAIDPDSYMYSFLTACQTDHANGKDNILWNFNFEDKVKIQNAGGAYGNTYDGYVTVFSGNELEDYMGNPVTIDSSSVNEADLRRVLNDSSKRPKLVITSAPVQYKEGDESTWITDRTVRWSYEAAGGAGFTGRLYIDDNANSRFEADEIVDTEDGAKGTLSKKFDPDYFGVVYWKLEVENNSGSKASTTGCLKIKRTNQEKIKVNLLQIMPDGTQEEKNGSDNSKLSLFLCTECQESRFVLHGNRIALNKYGDDSVLKLTAGFTDRNPMDGGWTSVGETTTVENNIKHYISSAQNTDSTLYLEGMQDYGTSGEFGFSIPTRLGVHQHRFGIVKYFSDLTTDSGNWTGLDDWNTNWFREVENDYDVNMNIIYISEFEKLIDDINDLYYGKDTSEIKTLRSKFSIAASEFQNAYNGMVKVVNGTYKNEVKNGGLTTNEKSAIQKYLFRKDAMGYGIAPTNAQILAAQLEAEAEVDKLTPALTGEERTNWVNEYKEKKLSEILYSNFETILDVFATSGGKLENLLLSYRSGSAVLAREVDYELSFDNYSDRPYYDFFSLYQSGGHVPAGYASEYQNWRDGKIYEQFFRKMFEYYTLLAAVNDSGEFELAKYYNCIVFGAAENFAGGDLNDAAIDSIIKYINDGGQTMLFYDSLTSGGDKYGSTNSTANMTKRLSSYFGMNAYSEPESDITSGGGSDVSTSEDTYEGTIKIDILDPWNSGALGTYTVDTAATEVNITINYNGNIGSDFSITAYDNRTSNEGNYGKHNIKINITATSSNQYYGSGGRVFVNGAEKGSIPGNGGTSSVSITVSNAIIKEEQNSGDNGGGNSAPLALNPSKLTYATALGQTSDSDKSTTFNYSLYYPNLEAEGKTHPRKDMMQFAAQNYVATNAAEQNNEGIVTMYPFSIGANLRVTPTVEGDFTINVADENLIVYYSLSGGTSGTMSSNYAANPLDGGNNYFVYQYQPKGNNAGTVTYLGAGRTVVTGYKRENNDERRFFINLILNTGRKSTKNSTLDLYDHSSSQVVTSSGTIQSSSLTNKTVQENGTLGYKMTITEGSVPKFSSLFTSDSSVEIAEVLAYYDLDYDEVNPDDEYHSEDGKHVLVYDKNFNKSGTYSKTENPWIASGYLLWIDEDTALKGTPYNLNGTTITPSMLEIQDNYLYNNEYTYIVVKVIPSKGDPIYTRIKIILKPELHDLT